MACAGCEKRKKWLIAKVRYITRGWKSKSENIGRVEKSNQTVKGKDLNEGKRKGNYTDVQLNIACRVSVMGMPNGKAAYSQPEICPTVIQAQISLGYLPYGFCGTRFQVSPCSVGRGGGNAGAGAGRGGFGSSGRFK